MNINPQRVQGASSAAFSLIEVMVAMLILGVALVGMVQGITTALGSNKDAEYKTVAALFAAGQIEELRAAGGIVDGETDGDCGFNLPLYHWKKSIKPSTISGLHEVSVDILHGTSNDEIYKLSTLLFEAPEDVNAGNPDSRKGGKSRSKRSRRS